MLTGQKLPGFFFSTNKHSGQKQKHKIKENIYIQKNIN